MDSTLGGGFSTPTEPITKASREDEPEGVWMLRISEELTQEIFQIHHDNATRNKRSVVA
jgi:hypothetical protein